ncbi:contact-dependent growth inhibition system immunity protein [Streptomyces sp. NBC_00536]|uniref:contact-dependent growth inhibition system immunity protein n=1 Tax=Streptomyces sp. NBC_00536 TaxID=2975769 RepID=UPI002E818154|nr:contact-dependent growth inhibition system immunity protein [Streptomyces sp. NBC_00536]WUC80663.1 contact-dependent growth inhibition system immunity protein [Streptomyces sp. NBC_00536]
MSFIDRSRSLEELDGQRWPDPPADATGLVKAIHALRKRPIKDLNPTEVQRLITQDVGIRWLLPIGVEILHDTAPNQARGGFYDDDLLSAVLKCQPKTWTTYPELVPKVKEILETLVDISPYIEDDTERFMRSIPQE